MGFRGIVLVLACALVAACGGGDGGGAGDTTATPPQTDAATEPMTTTTSETQTPQRPLRLELVAEGFDSPTHVNAPASEPNRLYVVERPGTIRVLEDGQRREGAFLDLTGQVTSGGEQGLLSVAFHPEYEQNGRLYVNYTNVNGDTRVVELTANAARTSVDSESARELLAVDQPYSNHNGGQLAFGPDGLLYVGMGDGGSGGDPENRAQNLSTPLGKLLRLDVDAPGAEWETVAYGLRNPWRFSFDRDTDDLLLADVGQSAQEEVNLVPWPPSALLNFGWDVFEGRLRYEDKPPNDAGRLVAPVHVYSHDHGCSITGGFVYRGARVEQARGRYFFGDYCSGLLWSFRPEGGEARDVRREPFELEGLTTFGEDADGEIYLASIDGAVYRLAG